MTLNEIHELDLQNIGDWPLAMRLGVIGFIAIAVVALGYRFAVHPLWTEYHQAQREQERLRQNMVSVQRALMDLKAFEQYLQDVKTTFGVMLRRLPGETEANALVEDISEIGIANHLVFNAFKPGTAVMKNFYAQRPIELEVRGTYHQLGHFVNDVASLPHIVTLHDVNLRPTNTDDTVSMHATAKIYWYLDTTAEAATKNKGAR